MPKKREASPIDESQGFPAEFPAWVDLGREICGDLPAAERCEWLVTNGLGGFGCGTVAGSLTRRYHGLLVAALKVPLGRLLLLSKFDETAEYGGRSYPLFTNRWSGGVVDPHGYRYLERFRLEGTTPVWTFACADALLEKRVWMQRGANTTYVRYDLVRASLPLKLSLKALVNYRNYHALTHAGDRRMSVEATERGLRVLAYEGATPFYVLSASCVAKPAHDWYHNFDLAMERSRGLDDQEDHLHAGDFYAHLVPGGSVTLAVSLDPSPDLDGQSAYQARLRHDRAQLRRWAEAFPRESSQAPAWIHQLVLAASQFIVQRPTRQVTGDPPAGQSASAAGRLVGPSAGVGPDGRSVIAGYPWFCDWGRDTMVALPGLALSTGHAGVARSVLGTFASFVDHGMLPNRFPDSGDPPEYNAVDTTLWFFEALRQYVHASGDDELLTELFPVLEEIVAWHLRGTRYNIHVDAADGLLYAGEPGMQLTWMDARAGDWVVTPRIGKPVEVNALWYNTLVAMSGFARRLKKPAGEYEVRAKQVRWSFQRFWNEAVGGCYDVLDGPAGSESSRPGDRPNQILAVSLPASPLEPRQQRGVVELCARRLLTPFGLRSLAPGQPQYHGSYRGGPQERDGAYHQGTVWGWLIGPFVLAHLRVFGDAARARSFLEPFAQHLKTYGLGTLGEIFDGDPPFAPRGCVAQAWTVAEVLRAWLATAVL
jgi:glycogen debranching enzyme